MPEHEYDLHLNTLDRVNILPVSVPRQSIDALLPAIPIKDRYKEELQSLSSPELIQRYINYHLRYNVEYTKRSFTGIVNNKKAHCFEAAYGFAYPILHTWGYQPRAVYINSDPTIYPEDHAIIAYRTMNGYGSVGTGADDYGYREATYPSFDALLKSIYPKFTTSVLKNDASESVFVPCMKGYSDPIELLDEKGTTNWFWNIGDNALEYFWYHSTDNVMCTEITTGNRYMYPPYMGE